MNGRMMLVVAILGISLAAAAKLEVMLDGGVYARNQGVWSEHHREKRELEVPVHVVKRDATEERRLVDMSVAEKQNILPTAINSEGHGTDFKFDILSSDTKIVEFSASDEGTFVGDIEKSPKQAFLTGEAWLPQKSLAQGGAPVLTMKLKEQDGTDSGFSVCGVVVGGRPDHPADMATNLTVTLILTDGQTTVAAARVSPLVNDNYEQRQAERQFYFLLDEKKRYNTFFFHDPVSGVKSLVFTVTAEVSGAVPALRVAALTNCDYRSDAQPKNNPVISPDGSVSDGRDPCEQGVFDSIGCQNGGTCYNQYSGFYTCACPPGYSGVACQIAPEPVVAEPPPAVIPAMPSQPADSSLSCTQSSCDEIRKKLANYDTSPDGTNWIVTCREGSSCSQTSTRQHKVWGTDQDDPRTAEFDPGFTDDSCFCLSAKYMFGEFDANTQFRVIKHPLKKQYEGDTVKNGVKTTQWNQANNDKYWIRYTIERV